MLIKKNHYTMTFEIFKVNLYSSIVQTLSSYLHSYIKTLVGNSFSHFKKGWEEYRQRTQTKRVKQVWAVLSTNVFGLIVPGSI